MYKTTLSLAILAVARLALATNPYCLLTAVNKFENPADQKTLCCKEANKVESYLEELCPSKLVSEAKDAFKKACDEGGYKDCSKADSSSSTKKSSSTSAPYPIVHTTTYYDEECSCTKTHTTSVTSAPGSTGFATATNPIATGTAAPGGGSGGAGGAGAGAGAGSGSGATGSPISPAGPESTNTPSSFKGAATKNVGSVAAGLIAVAGIAIVL